jgi:hypothetical protein
MSPEKSRCFKIFSDISKTTASIRGGGGGESILPHKMSPEKRKSFKIFSSDLLRGELTVLSSIDAIAFVLSGNILKDFLFSGDILCGRIDSPPPPPLIDAVVLLISENINRTKYSKFPS